MLKDRFVEASRSPDCAYAIDCKNGGRYLASIQPQGWRNFAVSPQTWAGVKDIINAIGGGDFYLKIKICVRETPAVNTAIFASGNSINIFRPASTYYLVYIRFDNLISGGVASYNGIYCSANATTCYIKSSAFADGVMVLEMSRSGGNITITADGTVIATIAGTANTLALTGDIRSNFDGNIFSASLKNSAGTVVWQALPSELTTAWRAQPVPGSAATGTWEVRNGLIKPTATATFADGRLTAGVIDTTVDLRGSTGSFSLFWRGSIANGIAVIQHGRASYEDGVLFYMNSTGVLQMVIGNGTAGVSATAVVTAGGHALVLTVDRAARALKSYVDGTLVATATIPADFGAINPAALLAALRLAKGTEAFAFYDRALTAEEVAAI